MTDVRRFTERRDPDAEKVDKIIGESEKMFLEYLSRFHNALNADRIDLKTVGDLIDQLNHIKKEQTNKYINSLMRPEKSKGSKIPSTMPVPSSSFQLKQSFYVTTNTLGNACIILNPFFLCDQSLVTNNTTCYVNNDSSLDGLNTSNQFKATKIGQGLPPVYNMYRLVSASVVGRYVGRLDLVQGLIGGAIIFDQNVTAATDGTTNANLSKYSQFSLAEDAFFQQENYVLQGIRELYFPLDNTFEQYTNLNVAKTGFAFLIYILNAPANVSSFKFDCYFNFECLPDVSFLNYIPTSTADEPVSVKERALNLVQKNPITKANEYDGIIGGSNVLDKLDEVQMLQAPGWLNSIVKFGSDMLTQGAAKAINKNIFNDSEIGNMVIDSTRDAIKSAVMGGKIGGGLPNLGDGGKMDLTSLITAGINKYASEKK
jgi:hypothetical protein